MFDKLNERLIEVQEKLRQRQKLLADIERTQQMLSEQLARLRELKTVLDKEKADVDKLEGLGLASLFHAVLGDKGEKLEKEKQEYLSAKLKYDECSYSVTALERDIDGMKERIGALGDIDAKHEEILAEKGKLISQQGGEKAEKLLENAEQWANLQSDTKELNEAIEAGKNALMGLGEVIEALRSARNWGTFDLLGGGMISTAVKHSRLNDAQREINNVQHSLSRFQRELADVGSTAELSIDIGSFATFADYVFDGLIVDWMVQSRIKRSLDTAIEVRNRIEIVLSNLMSGLRDVQEKAQVVEREGRKILEDA